MRPKHSLALLEFTRQSLNTKRFQPPFVRSPNCQRRIASKDSEDIDGCVPNFATQPDVLGVAMGL